MRFEPLILRLMTLAVCLGLSAGATYAQEASPSPPAEFDDDFGRDPSSLARPTTGVDPGPELPPSAQPPGGENAPDAARKPQAEEAPASDDSTSFVHNTVAGPTGGVHAVDARSGKPRSFRLAVAFDFFRKQGFLAPSAMHRHGGTALSLNVTPIEHLELAAQLSVVGDADTAGRPSVIQVVGDARLFAKGYASVKPWLSVGGDMELALLNAIGALGYQPSATSVGLRGNATFDLRKRKRRVPLIVRTNLRYYFDNSSKLIGNVEDARYRALSNAAPPGSEYRHLLTNVERFAYGINRTDAFSLGFGLELPFAPRSDILLSPLVEWSLSIPVNRQDYDCLLTRATNDRDGCLASEGFAARPSTLTLGVRAQPKLPGLGVLLALDVGTSGAHTFVRELAPNAPYALYFGLSYAYELFVEHKAPPARFERIEVPVEKLRGHVLGEVFDKQGLAPVPRALIHFEGTTLSDIACDQGGKFVSYPLDPGPVTMLVSADGYESAPCSAALPGDFADVTVRCELLSLPKLGSIRGRVLDAHGKPVSNAQVVLSGTSALTLQTDATGGFASENMSAGPYEARVEASGFLVQVVPLSVRDKSESAPILTLLPKPTNSLVTLTPKRIAIKQQVQFVAGSAEIAPASTALLSEVADVLLRNRDIARVEVQGHTDNSGTEAVNSELSERRSQAVREWLVKAGVEAERLSAAGYGSSRPLAPNITAQNRARNRRVELVILEQR